MASPRKDTDQNGKVVAENRKARFNYEIEETFEAGLELTGTEYEVLQVLLAHAGSVVRKTDLMQWALGRRLEAYDRTLDMHISNLRKKLGNDDPPRIETVRGLGYSYRIPT